MNSRHAIFDRLTAPRVLALLACTALIFFATGGSLLHQHASGPDTACHTCQALHLPAIAAAPLDLALTPQIIAWYRSLPRLASPSDSFSLHRAGRAPPLA